MSTCKRRAPDAIAGSLAGSVGQHSVVALLKERNASFSAVPDHETASSYRARGTWPKARCHIRSCPPRADEALSGRGGEFPGTQPCHARGPGGPRAKPAGDNVPAVRSGTYAPREPIPAQRDRRSLRDTFCKVFISSCAL